MIVALYLAVGLALRDRGFESNLVGDEGGYGPRLRSNEQAFDVVVEAIGACGLEPRRDVAIAVDVASTHFFDPDHGLYRLRADGDQTLDSDGMIDLLAAWTERYPIISIEDGLAEDDWAGWTALTKRLPSSVQLIGDDLFATQVARLRQRHRGPGRQRRFDQAQSGRNTHRDLPGAGTGENSRFSHRRLCPVGRNRGYNDRRPGGRDRRRPDQDRLGGTFREAREIQPVAANRRGAGLGCALRRAIGDLATTNSYESGGLRGISRRGPIDRAIVRARNPAAEPARMSPAVGDRSRAGILAQRLANCLV